MLTKEEIERKIYDEIIVDCSDENEASMGWYYYFEENLAFPFKAIAQLEKPDGRMEKQEVKITGLASQEEDFIGKDFNLNMQSGEYLFPVAYSKLSNIKASAETMETFMIWEFWIGKR